MKRDMLKRMCVTALLTAICVLVTAFVSLPLAVTGNINMGDCITMVACMLLGLWYAPAVGAMGGFIADLISGYAAYAPVTLVAKLALALVMCLFCRKRLSLARCALGIALGGIAMTACYFVYELLLYGLPVAAANALFCMLQAGINGVAALALYPLVKKVKSLKREYL